MQGSWSAVATEAWQLEVHGRQLLLLMLPRPVSPPQQPDLACRYLCHVQHIACCMIQLVEVWHLAGGGNGSWWCAKRWWT